MLQKFGVFLKVDTFVPILRFSDPLRVSIEPGFILYAGRQSRYGGKGL
jgi:hypothetical protein